MSSDDAYASFLEQANSDPSTTSVKTSSAGGKNTSGRSTGGKISLTATDAGAQVPAQLKDQLADVTYVSESDEAFESVDLGLGSEEWPDATSFAKLTGYPSIDEADVTILSVNDWDPRGDYEEVVEAIQKHYDNGEVKVYRIAVGKSRVEYWVVCIKKHEGKARLCGARTLAVES